MDSRTVHAQRPSDAASAHPATVVATPTSLLSERSVGPLCRRGGPSPVVYDYDRDFGPIAWDLIGLGSTPVTSPAIGPAVGLVAEFHAETSPTDLLADLAPGLVPASRGSWIMVRKFSRADDAWTHDAVERKVRR